MGTYGFAQFQIDVRQADEDLKRAIDDFKRSKTADEHEGTAPAIQKDAEGNDKRVEE